MKIIISENRVNQVIRKYLDDTFTPDYGWNENTRHGSYQEDVDKYGGQPHSSNLKMMNVLYLNQKINL